ncbi:MAG: phosphate ABC transporter permease [Oscillospiraceae bacterium]|nr:phosphate ABC transporter permease [Oscillospiraceae bacterium]
MRSPSIRRAAATLLFLLAAAALSACRGAEPAVTAETAATGASAADTAVWTTGTSADETAAEGVMTPAASLLKLSPENYPRIDGSTSTLPIVQGLFRAMFLPDTEDFAALFPESASRTVPSYRLLIAGGADLIFVPYASPAVLEEAAAAGVELEFRKIAGEALIFITSRENPAESITREQVRSLYLDNAPTTWDQLGGGPGKVVPICRNDDSGSQSQMDNLILDGQPMHPTIKQNYVELTMDGMLAQVTCYHRGGLTHLFPPSEDYALGYTLYSYFMADFNQDWIGNQLKILSYEGVMPSEKTIRNGTYLLGDGYYAVVRRDLPADAPARRIVRWLQLQDGQEMIRSLGLISSMDADPETD